MFSELVSAMISMAGFEGGYSPKKRLLGGPCVTHVPKHCIPKDLQQMSAAPGAGFAGSGLDRNTEYI